jgi:NADH-quinone oxidoreductase subunit C
VTIQEIHQKLKAEFGDAISDLHEAMDPFAVVATDKLAEVCAWLRDTPGLEMDFLQDETAVDYPEEKVIRVVYHLFSYEHRHGMKLKVDCDREDPKVETVEHLWPVANWFEREIHDLFGVDFVNNSDLRPLMLPDDWEGFPLRKDYEEHESYHGISHYRLSPLEGYVRIDDLKRKAAEAAAEEAATEEGEESEGAAAGGSVH